MLASTMAGLYRRALFAGPARGDVAALFR